MARELFDLAAGDDSVRFSPYCWRIRMALAHKGLDTETVPVRFTEKDKIAFSGQKLVPVLRDGETVLHESWDIALYLDRAYPDRPRLIDIPGLGVTNFVRSWAQTSLTIPVFKTIILDLFNGLADKDKDYFRTSREQRVGMPLEKFAVSAEDGRAMLKPVLTPVRDVLKQQPFFCGSQPAFADYIVFGVFMWARSASPIELLDSDDPTYAWRERMLDLYGGLARNAPRNKA
ncbi:MULTISPECIES: glutathione S-transferase family protein [unclassified Beijerinckia]|uniref:glutathione S-transferase family protein n=1 Tax=unclassified Beijerinckia TaxID=2638183 RepID=UPI0008980B3B|nr:MULTISPECIES: glutathione S-transferase family protein [unclassified Beijerinckia]MDH7796808.1 glutathione S-transferase [Beijerinckia sp. GAS462]SEC60711.1 Glutathione S-transferase [Beijerinckia sp. 28-YEA-48]